MFFDSYLKTIQMRLPVVNMSAAAVPAGPAAVTGFDIPTQRYKIGMASSLGLPADVVLPDMVAAGACGSAYKAAPFTSSIDGSSLVVGQPLYLTTSGGVSAVPPLYNEIQQIVGYLQTAAPDAVISGFIAPFAPTYPSQPYLSMLGDGSDGSLSLFSDMTLSQDMYFDTLIINPGATMYVNGFRIFCRTACINNGTISAVSSGKGTTGGGGGGAKNSYLSDGLTGAQPGFTYSFVGFGGVGGHGGAGINGTTGGAGGTFTSKDIRLASPLTYFYSLIVPGVGYEFAETIVTAAGGGSGGGSGGYSNSTYGYGGDGGGLVWIAAKRIDGSGLFDASGQDGGPGNPIGGGGGGGGGGGAVITASSNDISLTALTSNVMQGVHGSGVAGGADGSDGTPGATLFLRI